MKIILTGGNRLLLSADGRSLPGEGEVMLKDDAEVFRFGCYVAASAGDARQLPTQYKEVGIRESWGILPADDYTAVVKGTELVNWSCGERFCGACGSRLQRASEISKRCPACGREYFPRLNPAMVVLVKRGEEALLVHARNFRGDMKALVAGFVETGESLEECVCREIKEETSLDVDSVRYIGSQSWPFPHQLMMGFTARYKGGELRFADGELTDGGFFTRGNLPQLPTPPSLSRAIIDMWVRGEV